MKPKRQQEGGRGGRGERDAEQSKGTERKRELTWTKLRKRKLLGRCDADTTVAGQGLW